MITFYELLEGNNHKANFLQQADADKALLLLNASLAGAPANVKGRIRTRKLFENETDFWANADIEEVPEDAILLIPDVALRDQLLQARGNLKLTDAEKTALGITP